MVPWRDCFPLMNPHDSSNPRSNPMSVHRWCLRRRQPRHPSTTGTCTTSDSPKSEIAFSNSTSSTKASCPKENHDCSLLLLYRTGSSAHRSDHECVGDDGRDGGNGLPVEYSIHTRGGLRHRE